jgi:hypothetical protein
MAAKALFLRVKARDGVRLGVRQQPWHHGPALGIEIGMDFRPIHAVHPSLDRV